MSDRVVKIPGPDHPIVIEPNRHRVLVIVGDQVIADTHQVLTLREANYAAVDYIPAKDIRWSFLAETVHRTYCPYKGDCTYYTITSGSGVRINAAWTYPDPYGAVVAIKKYIAFYRDRVDRVEFIKE